MNKAVVYVLIALVLQSVAQTNNTETLATASSTQPATVTNTQSEEQTVTSVATSSTTTTLESTSDVITNETQATETISSSDSNQSTSPINDTNSDSLYTAVTTGTVVDQIPTFTETQQDSTIQSSESSSTVDESNISSSDSSSSSEVVSTEVSTETSTPTETVTATTSEDNISSDTDSITSTTTEEYPSSQNDTIDLGDTDSNNQTSDDQVNNTVSCPPGFYGDQCQYQDLCYNVICENGGICVNSTGKCDCSNSRIYAGPLCNVLNCGNRGYYIPNYNRCVCKAGFSGDLCDKCAYGPQASSLLTIQQLKEQVNLQTPTSISSEEYILSPIAGMNLSAAFASRKYLCCPLPKGISNATSYILLAPLAQHAYHFQGGFMGMDGCIPPNSTLRSGDVVTCDCSIIRKYGSNSNSKNSYSKTYKPRSTPTTEPVVSPSSPPSSIISSSKRDVIGNTALDSTIDYVSALQISSSEYIYPVLMAHVLTQSVQSNAATEVDQEAQDYSSSGTIAFSIIVAIFTVFLFLVFTVIFAVSVKKKQRNEVMKNRKKDKA